MGVNVEHLTQYESAGLALGICFVGTAVALLLAQERTRPNVALALVFLGVGLETATITFAISSAAGSDPDWFARSQGLLEASITALSSVYMSSLVSTGEISARSATVVRWVVRSGFVLAAWHAVTSLLFPTERLRDFTFRGFESSSYSTGGFWLFAGFWLLVAGAFMSGWIALALNRVDHAERDRAAAIAVSAGLAVTALFVPVVTSAWVAALAMTVGLWGQLRVTAAQARRSVFLSRFLSPRVTELVHEQGLEAVMQPHQAELTVVAADLRNFTPYAEGVPSQAVVDLLTEYYDVAGGVVARHGGTITAYAGDGILILVGAPLPREDHADAALGLARDLHVAMRPVLERWATKVHPLGLGVGVASGTVTVGTIETSERMEYTAIGTAVNLAARLCSTAAAGEVLVDEDAARLGNARVVERGSMAVRGLIGEQVVFALDETADVAQVTRGSATLSTESGPTTS